MEFINKAARQDFLLKQEIEGEGVTQQQFDLLVARVVALELAQPGLGSKGVGWVAIGDSITSEGRVAVNGWTAKASYFGNQEFRFRGEFAVGGSKTDSGLAVQLPQVLAMNPKPKACVVAFGSNHLSLGDVTTGIADIKTICQTLVDNDIQPILWTAPPRGDIPTSEQFITSWNTQIKAYQAEKGWPLIDAFAKLKNPASYSITPTSATYDGTHLSENGRSIVGQYVATLIPTWNVSKDGVYPLPVTGSFGVGNIAPNPLFAVGGTPGQAEGLDYQTDASFVPSLIASQTLGAGNWQRFTNPANIAPTGGSTPGLTTINVQEGEKYTISMRVRTNAGEATPRFTQVGALYFSNASWGGTPTGAIAFLLENTGLQNEDGILYRQDVVVPPTGAHMSILAGSFAGKPAIATARYVEYSQLSIIRQ